MKILILYGFIAASWIQEEYTIAGANDLSLKEFLIAFSIVMLMLSFVSERVSNLLKLHFQDRTIWIPYPHLKNKFKWGLQTKIRILAHRQPTDSMEKEREYRVLLINVIIGITIAAFSNANFFEIVDNISTIPSDQQQKSFSIVSGWKFDQLERYGWYILGGGLYLFTLIWSLSLIFFNRLVENDNKLPAEQIRIPFYALMILTAIVFIISSFFKNFPFTIFEHAFGFIITGLFLSLGSKFWHDLLDILFKYKNIHQRVNERSTYTDFDSPKKIIALANTSHYQVADELFKEYEDDIWNTDGVVSVGLKSRLDKIDGFFKRKIEVEYKNSRSQEKLLQLMERGSVTIEMNTFYLRDYLILIYTDDLIAAFPITKAVATINSNQKIRKEKPVFYAYNMNSKSSIGSFGVFEKTGKYFAHSNLHVFASSADLKRFGRQNVQNLGDKFVGLVVGDKKYDNIKISDFEFGNSGTWGMDYCYCEITRNIYEECNRLINTQSLKSEVTEDEMKMFGAVSKKMTFKKYRETTRCRVNYGSFVKELKLIKIESTYLNIQKGDSGSIVNYKVNSVGGKAIFRQGIIVAKSAKYAYMSKIIQ